MPSTITTGIGSRISNDEADRLRQLAVERGVTKSVAIAAMVRLGLEVVDDAASGTRS